MQVRAQQGDTLDLICWRYFGRTLGLVEQVLASNPQLAGKGPVLPHGQLVILPDQVPPAAVTQQQVQLWD
ncbi:MAG: tail protein X [Pseudomonas sp.]|uniref:tail protein X n=1 Tax=Pseudomonas sp. TaxID=306 RepID=UPI0033908ED5